MADSAGAAAPKPTSSVKLVLLGEAAVGKVGFEDVHVNGTHKLTLTPQVLTRPALRKR